MNCKQGDLVLVVRGHFSGLLGSIAGPGVAEGSDWSVNIFGKTPPPPFLPTYGAPDNALRPIRDNDGTDETLIWAGKPQGVTA